MSNLKWLDLNAEMHGWTVEKNPVTKSSEYRRTKQTATGRYFREILIVTDIKGLHCVYTITEFHYGRITDTASEALGNMNAISEILTND